MKLSKLFLFLVVLGISFMVYSQRAYCDADTFSSDISLYPNDYPND